ncbi:hypothetical protein GL273_01240 [Aeromonas jandaei]|uniref:hypothetical protein n=1 Tax=Aeromonas jandaei TaxID=650 RepID=UPI001C5BC870|nr:hypothetical protein [Aeromonas jandaei]MBW3804451.1 hypothetical protein [Aeromonas jandaei]
MFGYFTRLFDGKVLHYVKFSLSALNIFKLLSENSHYHINLLPTDEGVTLITDNNNITDPFAQSQELLTTDLNGVEIKFRICNLSGEQSIFISTPPCESEDIYYFLSFECVASNSIIMKVNKTKPY